jgi:(R,R)-butanediol dehydrogenase / meso-butanediol dehydrogenase / diacetyl reductase
MMQAAVFHAARDIRVEHVEPPRDLRAHEVLVRPQWCGICGTDLHEYLSGPIVIPADPHPLTGAALPQILGHEFSAMVAETGPEVAGLRPGDRVSVMPLITCGRCYYCRRGLQHLCTNMACTGLSSAWGGIAELAVVFDHQLTRLPDRVDDVQGALIEPAAVAACGVDQVAVAPGEAVLITGAGPIGALAALYAHSLGVQVLIYEPNPSRAALARSLEVAEILEPSPGELVAEVLDRTGGLGVHGAVECAGAASALRDCIAATRSRGVVAQTGLHTGPAEIDPMQLSLREISLVGTWCYPVVDWPRLISLVAAGRYPVERVVTGQIAIGDVVDKGFDALCDPSGDQVKVLVGAGQ